MIPPTGVPAGVGSAVRMFGRGGVRGRGRGQAGAPPPPSSTATWSYQPSCYKCGTFGHIAVQCEHKSRLCYGCGSEGHERRDCPERGCSDATRRTPSGEGAAGKKGTGTGARPAPPPPKAASTTEMSASMVSLGTTATRKRRQRPEGSTGLTPPEKQQQRQQEGQAAVQNSGHGGQAKRAKFPYATVAAGGKKVYILDKDNAPLGDSVVTLLGAAFNDELIRRVESSQPGGFLPSIREKLIRRVGILPGVLVWDLPDSKTVEWAKAWVPSAVLNHPLRIYQEGEKTPFALTKLTGHLRDAATAKLEKDKLAKLIRLGADQAGASGGRMELIMVTETPRGGGIVTIGVDEEAKESIASVGSQFIVGAAGTIRWCDPTTRQATRTLEVRKAELLNQRRKLDEELGKLDEAQHDVLEGCAGALAAMSTPGDEEVELVDEEEESPVAVVSGSRGEGQGEEDMVTDQGGSSSAQVDSPPSGQV